MTVLPPEIAYGKVEARLLQAVADAGDADRLPDAVPAVGTIRFAPKNQIIRVAGAEPTVVAKQPITCSIDAEGYLSDLQGGRGVWLVTGVYTVTYTLPSAFLPPHDIEVTAGHNDDTPLDLVAAMPPGGPILTATQYAELSARMDVLPGVDYAPVAVRENISEIPTRLAGRVDLVYTQPTTVHFENPGRTDIVLSIEGYEHITWEGVAVHGSPDTTGVVWASAMWRDRDSTWHLLCEQDPGSGGGGGGLSQSLNTRETVTFGPVGYAEAAAVALLGGAMVEPERTVAADGSVSHEAGPMPPSIVDAVPDYEFSHLPYAKQAIYNIDTGATTDVLKNYIGETPAVWNSAMGFGMFVLEHGTISEPGGHGFRVTVTKATPNWETRTALVSFTYEVTEAPIQTGWKSSITMSLDITQSVPGWHWRISPSVTDLPGNPNQRIPFILQNDPDLPSSFRITASLGGIDPIPAVTPDADGFAIHTLTYTDLEASLSLRRVDP